MDLALAPNGCRHHEPAWQVILDAFDEAPPGLVAERALRHRCDTKFALSSADASGVLETLAPHYLVLPAAGARVASYRTLYFDTPGLASYHAHRCGRRVRHKIRIRHYVERRLSTLEVKTRRTDFESTKSSQPRAFLSETLAPTDHTFLAARCSLGGTVVPQVRTLFRRITLLHRSRHERVTFDLDLRVASDDCTLSFRGAVIAEVKQWPFARQTPAMQALQRRGGALTLSKYCLAVALTRPQQPHNRFLPGLRRLTLLAQA